MSQGHHARRAEGHDPHHPRRDPHGVHAARSHTFVLTAFALVIFLLGVVIVFGLPTAEAGFRSLIGSFAPSNTADYSPNRGSTIKPQRPLPTP